MKSTALPMTRDATGYGRLAGFDGWSRSFWIPTCFAVSEEHDPKYGHRFATGKLAHNLKRTSTQRRAREHFGDNCFVPLPNSLPWMESVDAKMIRAHEHLETLERETLEYLSTVKPTMVLKTAPNEPCPWLVMWVNDYIPPIRLSVLLGDCVHNMRSALNNLVCGLAHTVDPSCTCKGTAFPYRENEATLMRMRNATSRAYRATREKS